jgi:2Fe-2S ferredoxin
MSVIRLLSRRPDGTLHEQPVPFADGQTAMQAAVAAGVQAIAADCGGSLTCATCHVYVEPAWADRLPPPGEDELGMLAFTAAERRDTSRLSCQIVLGPALDGLALELPDRQY